MIRRNPVRQLLLLLGALTIFGCSVYDPSLITSGSGGTGGGGTGGGGTGGGGTGGGGTGGDCVPTNGGVEICDALDNDCNGETNDGPAADSCRMMGRANATSRCTMSGACLLQSCDMGFYNCDGRPENGCESLDADVECGACGKVCEDDAGMIADAGDASLGDASVDVDASMGCVPSGLEVCDGIDNDCDGTVDNGNTCPAGCTGRSGVGGAYALCTAPQNWSAARAACAAAPLLMRLVRINDGAENAFVNTFVNDLLGGAGRAWIGAHDSTVEGEWRWVQGTMLNGPQFWMGGTGGSVVDGLYANWDVGLQPDDASGGEDCAQMVPNGTWNDLPCGSATMAYVCEK